MGKNEQGRKGKSESRVKVKQLQGDSYDEKDNLLIWEVDVRKGNVEIAGTK